MHTYKTTFLLVLIGFMQFSYGSDTEEREDYLSFKKIKKYEKVLKKNYKQICKKENQLLKSFNDGSLSYQKSVNKHEQLKKFGIQNQHLLNKIHFTNETSCKIQKVKDQSKYISYLKANTHTKESQELIKSIEEFESKIAFRRSNCESIFQKEKQRSSVLASVFKGKINDKLSLKKANAILESNKLESHKLIKQIEEEQIKKEKLFKDLCYKIEFKKFVENSNLDKYKSISENMLSLKDAFQSNRLIEKCQMECANKISGNADSVLSVLRKSNSSNQDSLTRNESKKNGFIFGCNFDLLNYNQNNAGFTMGVEAGYSFNKKIIVACGYNSNLVSNFSGNNLLEFKNPSISSSLNVLAFKKVYALFQVDCDLDMINSKEGVNFNTTSRALNYLIGASFQIIKNEKWDYNISVSKSLNRMSESDQIPFEIKFKYYYHL